METTLSCLPVSVRKTVSWKPHFSDAPSGAVRACISRSGRSLALGICPWRALHACVRRYGPRGPDEACVISARSRSEVMTLDRDRAEVHSCHRGMGLATDPRLPMRTRFLQLRRAALALQAP